MHVAVIGAGLQGVCTAYFLAGNGAAVTVIERRAGPALETSYGNAGYIQVECPEIWNRPGVLKALPHWWRAGLGERRYDSPMVLGTGALPGLVPWGIRFLRAARPERYRAHCALNHRLALYSVEVMAGLRAREAVAYSQSANGALWLFRDAAGIERCRPLLDYLGEQGAQARILAVDAAVALEPSLEPIADALAGAIYFQRDESGDAYSFTRALADAAAANSVRFRYGEEVCGIDARAGAVAVRTSENTLEADAVVLAAGTRSRHLAARLGIPLPIAPAKGYSITIPFGDFAPRPRHTLLDRDVHVCVNPIGDRLRVAGTAEFIGHDASIPAQRVDYLLRLVAKVLPAFAGRMDRSEPRPFAGLRPLSADGLPMIGETRVPNVHVNTGHGALGWTQAAGSGKALADAITGLAGFELAPYSPLRFARRSARAAGQKNGSSRG